MTGKKGHATPPSPNHPMRRMRFFVEHQDDPMFPNAKHEAQRMSRRMAEAAKSNKRKVKLTPAPQEQPRPVEHLHKEKKKPFLERIISKFKKASQRGN